MKKHYLRQGAFELVRDLNFLDTAHREPAVLVQRMPIRRGTSSTSWQAGLFFYHGYGAVCEFTFSSDGFRARPGIKREAERTGQIGPEDAIGEAVFNLVLYQAAERTGAKFGIVAIFR